MKTTVQAPISRLYEGFVEIFTTLEEAFASVLPYAGRTSDEMLGLKTFSRAVELYERIDAETPLPTPENAALYTAMRLEISKRPKTFSIFIYSLPLNVASLLAFYYDLPEDERPKVLERSDELFAIRPLTRTGDHLAVWDSDTPVHFLHSHPRRFQDTLVSGYELGLFNMERNSAHGRTYGTKAAMLLSTDELGRAAVLLENLAPGSNPKELSAMAGVRESQMSADVLLQALDLGYCSRAQLMEAGNLLGLKNRRCNYFDLIFADGDRLAAQARSNL